MITMLKNWEGAVEINGTSYKQIDEAISACNLADNMQFSIKLLPKVKPAKKSANINKSEGVQEYRITVKKYMTQKASSGFDFMDKWNNNEPMPLRTMVGTIDKETRGMIHMKLHGDIYAEKICTCMKCGRTLTNKVSQYFGIGPECGGHNYVSPFETQEELDKAIADYRKHLQSMTWEGWIIKSAITEQEEI